MTYEIFTIGYSIIQQSNTMEDAIAEYRKKYGNADLIAVIEHERGQEFLTNKTDTL